MTNKEFLLSLADSAREDCDYETEGRLKAIASEVDRKSNFQKVVEFHKDVMGFKGPNKPSRMSIKEEQLRFRIIEEEYKEFEDLVNSAKELADFLYVLYGTADHMGIDIDDVFNEVHNSNMTKKGGKIREDGKQLKPDTYKATDILVVLRRQGYVGN